MKLDPSSVILFVKTPVAGYVKTRLASNMGDLAAAGLYRCFVNDLVRKIDAAEFPLHIFYDPPDAEPLIRRWLGEERVCSPQNGDDDLGERMKKAFQEVFSTGIKRAVLVGSDLPDLPAEILTDALAALTDHPAVIGPCKDGGYYLIGFNSEAFTPAVFDGIPWSSDQVLPATLNRFVAAGLPVHRTPEWRDIDTAEDLTDLIATLIKHPENAPETAVYLSQVRLWRIFE